MSSVSNFLRQQVKIDFSSDEWDWVDISEFDNSNSCIIMVEGPEDTPYAKGLFNLSVNIGNMYPHVSPKVTFYTPIWHPMVDEKTGRICQDYFSDDWTPIQGLTGFLLRIRSFFHVIKVLSPVNQVAGEEINRNDGSFEKHAQEHAKRHAFDS